jgi:hypothetical protein
MPLKLITFPYCRNACRRKNVTNKLSHKNTQESEQYLSSKTVLGYKQPHIHHGLFSIVKEQLELEADHSSPTVIKAMNE